MSVKILLFFLQLFLTSHSWIHDAKIIDYEVGFDRILPVNYFYVQFVDVYGRKIQHISQFHQDAFELSIKSPKCRRFITDKIYTGDGLFILRIKTFEVCNQVEIELKFHRKNIQNSPLCIDGIFPDTCKCQRNISKVLKSLKCEDEEEQIVEDLKQFKLVNFTSFRDKLKRRFEKSRSSSICNYVVKSGRIYRKCYGEYVGFKMFIDHILTYLNLKVHLPDLELLFNLGDWPLSKDTSMPIFSWCGSTDTFDIVIPTYDLTESTLNMMQRSILDILSVQREKFKWKEKEEKAFFRGRDSRRERLDVVELSKSHPNLFNSSITNFFFYKDEIEKFGPKVPHISFFDFFKFKYQLNLDGTVAAYRFPYLLAGNSAVLKQDSPYYEHFYRKLKEFEHYVPFNRKPHVDLVEKVLWLKNHDESGEKIMRNARKFARENLAPRNIFCYYLKVFNEFSKRIVSDIEVTDEMEEVRNEKDNKCDC